MLKYVSIKKNIIFQTAYQILNTCLPLITAPYLARVLGAEQLGIFSYTSSIVAYFALISMLGTVNYGTRSIASVKTDKEELSHTFWSIYGLQVFVTSIVLVAYIAYLIFFCNENKLIFIIQAIVVIDCFLNINWLFFGLECFRLTVIINFFVRIVTVISILLFVNDPSGLWVYTVIITGGTLVSNAVLWIYLPNVVSRSKIRFCDILAHFKQNFILFVPLLAMSVYHTMDKTMLGLLSTYEQSGFYYNVDKVINIPVGILAGVSTVLLPRMSSLITVGKKRESDRLFLLSLEVVVVLSVAIAFGISAIAKEFTPIFFGTGYDDCIILIIILSPVLVIKAFSITARNQFLIPYKLEKILILSVVIGAVINFGLNLILIPSLGAMGAIIGTLIAECTACLVQFFVMKQYINLVSICKKTVLYLFVGCGMFVFVRFVSWLIVDVYIKLAIEIIAGFVFYSVMCILYWMTSNHTMYNIIFCNLLKNLLKR